MDQRSNVGSTSICPTATPVHPCVIPGPPRPNTGTLPQGEVAGAELICVGGNVARSLNLNESNSTPVSVGRSCVTAPDRTCRDGPGPAKYAYRLLRSG